MKLSTTKPCLPKNVRKYVDEMYTFLDKKHEDGFSFFEEAEMGDPEVRMRVLEEEMGPVCIANWIQNGEAGLTRSQAGKILERIPILYTMHTLKQKGFMDSIEGCDGEEVFFLSDKGKEFGVLMGWDKKVKS
jgi:hypothetical protein